MLVNTTSTQQPNCLATFWTLKTGSRNKIVSSFYIIPVKAICLLWNFKGKYSCHSVVYFMNTVTNFAVYNLSDGDFKIYWNDARHYEFTCMKLYEHDSGVRNTHLSSNRMGSHYHRQLGTRYAISSTNMVFRHTPGWLGSCVVSVLDSGAEGPGFKSQPRRCRVTVLGKLFTRIVPVFTQQRNW